MSIRLFVDQALAQGTEFALPPDAARHAQVRRVQPGDELVLFNGQGGEWAGQVVSMGRQSVQVAVQRFDAVERELPLDITLAVAMPANERMDWLVEKATELGVARIMPLHSERSVLRLAGERAERKRAHWQAVAVAACEQCGRTRVPRVDEVKTLPAALAALQGADIQRWLLSLGDQASAPKRHAAAPVVVLSGPEGGFTAAEEQLAHQAGFAAITLGPRVLRAETAALAALAWLGLAR